jgi:DNA-damage-inducible protein D
MRIRRKACKEISMSLNGKKIATLTKTFEGHRMEIGGIEAWSCRALMTSLGYKTWQNFRTAIERAWVACKNSARDPAANFLVTDGSEPWVPDRIFSGPTKNSKRGRPQEDVIVTRYGAYLIAMSGDERIEQIAFAKRYFATQTRKQEVLEQQLLDDDRVKAHGKFAKSEAELREIVYERGGNDHGFNTVRNRGHKAYFGRSPEQVAEHMGVPEDRDYVDFMDPINVKALDLAQSITTRKARAEGLATVGKITKTNEDSHRNIRKGVVKSGFIPEQAKAVEDIRNVQGRLEKQQVKRLRGK